MRRRFLAAFLGAIPLLAAGRVYADDPTERYEKRIRPLLIDNCLACHGPALQKAGLRLDRPISRAMAGKVLAAVRYDGTTKMPPAGKLSNPAIADLEAWVRQGASYTPGRIPSAPQLAKPAGDGARWAFVRPKPVLAPPMEGARTDIDAFLLEKLHAAGLAFAPPADRRTLIRRVTFDLTGLPPTPEEVAVFVADKSPAAYKKVVDRLLASPRYGERWARHWLDVVRYADSLDARGLGGEGDIADAWRYRDWVIDAFNADMPYDRFVVAQIAGDLLPTPDGDLNVPGTIATSFLAIGNWGNGDADKDKILTDIVDDQIDAIGKAFLGLTISCARCHDHKFDPITQRDYYGLAGIFFSTHILPRLTPKGQGELPLRVALETKAQRADRDALARSESELAAFRDRQRLSVAERLASQTESYLAAVKSGHGEGLDAAALARWREALSPVGYPLMTTPIHDLLGNAGVDGVRGPADTPSQLVNGGDVARQILTFTLPAKSVAVHPGPKSGVAVSWVSPIDGTVAVSGKAADADPACGDGVAWRLTRRAGGNITTLAEGAFANGGAEAFAGAALQAVAVRAGESVELLILPKSEHTCDTTVVELSVKSADGHGWSLTADTLRSPGRNPAPDAFGHPAVWRFGDMAGAPGEKLPDGVRAAWAAGDIHGAAEAFRKTSAGESPFAPVADEEFPTEIQAELGRRQAEIVARRARIPATIAYANGAQEGGVPDSPHAGLHDVRIHRRGRYDTLGDLVPRGAPAILCDSHPLAIEQGSGRLELARWIASERNPQAARVIVNRVWQHHFGLGIVRTPSNFGKLGDRPSHPELLDWLANQFVRDGWSLKKLHRQIVLSTAYRQSSVGSAAAQRSDPDNRLLGRQNRWRLEAEALRDNLLAVSGQLDLTPGGIGFRDLATPRRSVYYLTVRSDRSGFGPLFDAADSTASVEKRTVATVAPQALFLLNNDFAHRQALALAARLKALPGSDDTRIERAYQLLFGRGAKPAEATIGKAALARIGWELYAQALLCTNEFLYVD